MNSPLVMPHLDEVIKQVRAAFAGVVRPTNEGLLHTACRDGTDLEVLATYGSWPEVPDEVVIAQYAALAFLSAEGFRHFIPAYMIWVLRHRDSGEAVVDSTVWAFLPELHGSLAPFVRSKWSALTSQQEDAVTSFLGAMVGHHDDASAALRAWEFRHSAEREMDNTA